MNLIATGLKAILIKVDKLLVNFRPKTGNRKVESCMSTFFATSEMDDKAAA